MRRRCLLLAVLALALSAGVSPADAHKPSDSQIRLTPTDSGVDGQWDVALRDLDNAIGLDADGDGTITWGEVRTSRQRIQAYVFSRLHLQADRGACEVLPGALLIDTLSDGAYAVSRFAAACGGRPERLTVGYDLFAGLDAQHRGLLRMETEQGVQTAILGPERPEVTFVLAAADPVRQFLHFAQEGVWHIWTGFDHILFLLALLLPCVLVRRGTRWEPEPDFRSALLRVLAIVTAFTVSHSITLALSVLGVVRLPPRLIEGVVAATVVLSAMNNIICVVHKRMWLLAFGFGLAHGFSFANVLLDLDLPASSLVLSLLGFNAGVELGQLVIVATFLPLAYLWRRSRLYAHVAMPAGSLATGAIASLWLVERAFDVTVGPL